jgi:predicted Zn-dependent peptidase
MLDPAAAPWSGERRGAARAALGALCALLVVAAPGHAAGSKKSATSSKAAPTAKTSASATGAPAAEEHVLSNGLRVVLIPRHLSPTFAGGWIAHVGSANERPGITGISHLFEHMMFKGTHVIGTHDYDKDVKLIDAQEALQEEMRGEMSKLRDDERRGKIDDMSKPENRTPRYRQLEAQFDSLVKEQRANMVKNEFDQILTKNGGTGVNAFTNNDMTVYFENLPSNKLELWFWLEADRLKNRVFREFYSERDVVYEERRLRTEATPTGKFQESFDAVFWDSSPYSWPVVGWPSDIPAITKVQADEYYGLYYAPQNLTAILVGDFDPKTALALAETYLGSIPAGTRKPPEMLTSEMRPLAEKRFYGEAETNPAVTIRWHTVAFVNQDVPALEVLASALEGPTGRLRRSIVLGQQLATRATASQESRKYEGMFTIDAEAKEGHTPEELEKAIEAEVEKLQKEPLTPDELQSVKNRYLASRYRQLTNNFLVFVTYAIADGRGKWQDADRIPQAVQQVTADDVQRVAKKYFTKESRAVAIWTRKGGAKPDDPALAGVPDEAKPMVKQMLAKIDGAKDAAELQQIITRIDQMSSQVPPNMKPAIDLVRSRAQSRMDQLAKEPTR